MTEPTGNRWLPLIGGVMMNIVLGTSYAWSVFILPLESDFGWTRTETSITFTIIVMSIAFWFVVAGRLQDRFGPRPVAALGGESRIPESRITESPKKQKHSF